MFRILLSRLTRLKTRKNKNTNSIVENLHKTDCRFFYTRCFTTYLMEKLRQVQFWNMELWNPGTKKET
jgi:hypothetical protein